MLLFAQINKKELSMKITEAQVRILITLATCSLSSLSHATADQVTSCIHGDSVLGCSSVDEKYCDNDVFPNKDEGTHICSEVDVERAKEKYKSPPTGNVFRGEYSFLVDPIPRRNCFDEEAMEFIQQGLPVVLENCTFHNSAKKWTISYLLENLQDKDHTAYFSENRTFLYYSVDRIKGAFKDFNPPTKRMLLYFKNFSEIMEDLQKADNGSRAYFQSLLYLHDGISASMKEDIDSFNYTWLLQFVRRFDWGEDLTNMLFVGMPDVVTPAHFDILENLYVQIYGRKRIILFSPDCFRSLYPYPVGHPHDRQTQVDFEKPDLNRFPRFSEIRGMEVALEPDEVLYIPTYWWHYIESESQSNTISVNFWFDPKNDTRVNEDSLSSSNTSGVELEEAANKNETDESTEEQSKSSISSEVENERRNENFHPGIDEKHTEEEIKEEEMKDEEMSEEDDEEDDEEEDDEQEKTLTAAQYLALLRDTEVSLFKATFSHEKVKQILEELLSRRFDFLTTTQQEDSVV